MCPLIAGYEIQKLILVASEENLLWMPRGMYDALKRLMPSTLLPNLHYLGSHLYLHWIESIDDGFLLLHLGGYNISFEVEGIHIGRTGSFPQAIDEIKSIRIAIRHINMVSLSVVRGDGTDSL